MTLTKEQSTALEASIEHWEKIVTGDAASLNAMGCALCQAFIGRSSSTSIVCGGCPVYKKTGQNLCKGTPYVAFHAATNAVGGRVTGPMSKMLARSELDFLKSLRDPVAAPAPDVQGVVGYYEATIEVERASHRHAIEGSGALSQGFVVLGHPTPLPNVTFTTRGAWSESEIRKRTSAAVVALAAAGHVVRRVRVYGVLHDKEGI